MDLGFSALQQILLLIPALLIGLTFHELAHAVVADRLGDGTPRHAGRLTLNPLAHLDLIGSLMLLVAKFGWAKPVPVNPANFENPRQGMMLVSLAGPLTNVLVAIAGSLILHSSVAPALPGYAIGSLFLLVQINLILAVFNLIPIPPLDGSKVLAGLMPVERHPVWASFEQYGFVILLLVLLFPTARGILFTIMGPPLNFLWAALGMNTFG